jgi:DNA-binding response OmpR family regulator
MVQRQILVIEDDPSAAETVRVKLEVEGFSVAVADTGEKGIEMARAHAPDLVILDWMLPDMEGPAVCQVLRGLCRAPIIMLTAKADEIDRVVGLEVGADDYVTKPFGPKELAARVRAQLRRRDFNTRRSQTAKVSAAGIEIDPQRMEVTVDGQEVSLTPTEFRLLELMVRHPGRIFSAQQLLQEVWGEDEHSVNLVEAHMSKLRRKVESNPHHPGKLKTIRSQGYWIVEK